jgi:uncharacterized membrane protein
MEEEKNVEKKQENAIAIFSYIGILFIIPLLVEKDDEFVKYHAKQGIVLFVAELITGAIMWIPVIGWIVGFVAWVIWLILGITGIMNVLGGKKKPLPIIGQFADRFKI